MKFKYQYRTKDNVVHDGVVSASSRDVAYELLRKGGVRPFALIEAPGFWNKILGKGKRWMAIVFLLGVIVALGCIMLRARLESSRSEISERRQIYGDPVLMEDLVDGLYVKVFPDDEGARVLAFYAQPGGVDGIPDSFIRSTDVAAALRNTVGMEIAGGADDVREVRELKAIVRGMKNELRYYLSDGVGTVESYLKRLEERRIQELEMYMRAVEELSDVTDVNVREAKNAALRAVGLRTVPKPKSKKSGKADGAKK